LTGWSACSKSSNGELFFGGFAGGVGFFPSKLQENEAPRVVLTSFEIAGAGVPIDPSGPLRQSITYTDRITLSYDQNTFSLQFAPIDYASPEINYSRYKLEGLDAHWQEVGPKVRRATYTALPPGRYRFRVQAANGRGPWTEPGASLEVRILPPWWATWWFRTVYATLGILALAGAYAIRMSQVSRQLTIRMEERINERTRIARDLHDTLLQGLLSASLQLSIARAQATPDTKSNHLIDGVVNLLRQMIQESRNTVRGLRVHQRVDQGLERAISQIPRDLGVDRQIDLLIEGERRLLKPAIRDEIYWIARELLANAFRHANASTIEVVIEYSRNQFRLLVRDNGKGIDLELLRSGREDHWGLPGIAERAKRIGGALNLSSAVGAGTEISLTVSASSAFERKSEERV
jgi:signal transduction histidine kinase